MDKSISVSRPYDSTTNIIVNIPELTADEDGTMSKISPGTPLSPQFCDKNDLTPVKYPSEDVESNKNIVFKVKVNTKKEMNQV